MYRDGIKVGNVRRFSYSQLFWFFFESEKCLLTVLNFPTILWLSVISSSTQDFQFIEPSRIAPRIFTELLFLFIKENVSFQVWPRLRLKRLLQYPFLGLVSISFQIFSGVTKFPFFDTDLVLSLVLRVQENIGKIGWLSIFSVITELNHVVTHMVFVILTSYCYLRYHISIY